MSSEELNNLRHSTAHLLAAAVLQLYPDTKLTIGPSIEDGFYYDFDFKESISEKDFPRIEGKMRDIVKQWRNFEKIDSTEADALQRVGDNEYKKELIQEIVKKGEPVTFYKSGEFIDLCRGGHVEEPSKELKHFKLLSVAGAYWRGNEKNKMLTRIYGTAFPSKEELDEYIQRIEDAKKRDHRKLGKELDLFTFSELVGSGLPLFTPKGTILRDTLIGYSEKLQREHGFQKVWIPHITKIDLYKKSGHWDKFGDELFLVKSQETDDEFALKPMNCPHHIQIYSSKPRSYRDLPVRYFETTTQYRDEKAGEIAGLSRVRAITVDDAHIFVRRDQIEQEFENIMSMIKKMYSRLEMKFKVRLSFRDDSDKYLGDKKDWEFAQEILEKVVKKLELDYFVATGEAAFYGPKIDVMVVDALGREWQCATEQLDFVQPERFGLTYADSDGSEKRPFMIHKALLGSIERFLSVYIEHTMGNFPVWLAPVQVAVLPVSEKHLDLANEVGSRLSAEGLRHELNDDNKTLGAKIRTATLQKVPYMVIIGDKEVAQKDLSVTVRTREGQDLGLQPVTQFVKTIRNQLET